MIYHPYPCFYPPCESHQGLNADDLDPKELLGWIGLATALVAGGRWMWRKIVKPVTSNLWGMLTIGAIARRIEARVDDLAAGVAMARARSRVLLNNRVDVAIWESDEHGDCVFANRFMLDVLGRPFEDVAGQNWRAIIGDDDKDAVFIEWAEAMAKGLDFNRTYSWVHRDGSLIPIRVTSQRIVEGHKVLGWLCEAKIIHSFIGS